MSRETMIIEKEEQAKELANQLTNFINSSNNDIGIGEFIKAFSRQHRTLQQSSFGMFLRLIEHMASDEYHTDGRNEDSKKMAKTLLEGFKLAKKEEYILDGVSEQRATEYVTIGDGAKPSRYLPFI